MVLPPGLHSCSLILSGSHAHLTLWGADSAHWVNRKYQRVKWILFGHFKNLGVSQGGDKSGPGRRRGIGSGACTTERAGESSTVLFAHKLCVKLAQAAFLALSSGQIIAVNNRINTQYCWLLPPPQAAKAGKCLVLFHSRQIRIITPYDSETPENMLGRPSWYNPARHGTSWQSTHKLVHNFSCVFCNWIKQQDPDPALETQPALVLKVADSRCRKAKVSNCFSSLGNCKLELKWRKPAL